MSHPLLKPFAMRFSPQAEAPEPLAGLALRQHTLRLHQELFREGDTFTQAHFLVEGIACRFKTLSDGKRVILGFLFPGDVCECHPELAGQADHGVAALTPCTLGNASLTELCRAMEGSAALRHAIRCAAVIEAAIQRQWLARMSFAADVRLAQLLCEMRLRLALAGKADGSRFTMPLTQQTLGEATGLSTVHVNRTLQHLKLLGLIGMQTHHVLIPALNKLEEFAQFDGGYLNRALVCQQVCTA
jgi:CRP-like cAMP-binding protein